MTILLIVNTVDYMKSVCGWAEKFAAWLRKQTQGHGVYVRFYIHPAAQYT